MLKVTMIIPSRWLYAFYCAIATEESPDRCEKLDFAIKFWWALLSLIGLFAYEGAIRIFQMIIYLQHFTSPAYYNIFLATVIIYNVKHHLLFCSWNITGILLFGELLRGFCTFDTIENKPDVENRQHYLYLVIKLKLK